jgi:clathrin heavy chain
MFTALGVALCKYHPERLMEHLRIFYARINIAKLVKEVEAAHLW